MEGAAKVAELVGVAGVIAGAWLAVMGSEARHRLALRRAHRRAQRAYYAAIEAAEDDPIFAPEAIEHSVIELVMLAASVWRTGNATAMNGRPDAYIVGAWARSREYWLGRDLNVRGKPATDILQVVNREGHDEDRVIVRVRLHVHRKHPRAGLVGKRTLLLDERWTLASYDGKWALLSIDGDPLAGPILTAPLIPNRSFDDARLLEESLVDMANAQKVQDDKKLHELVGADEPPSLAVLDLSVLDSRFLPPLIAAELAHIVDAWELAVNGSEAPLESLAEAEAIEMLLRPSVGTRMVIRDAILKSWEASHLHLSRQPPAIEIRLVVEAVRYVLSDAGGPQSGSDQLRNQVAMTWMLELTDTVDVPWRLARTTNPAAMIVG